MDQGSITPLGQLELIVCPFPSLQVDANRNLMRAVDHFDLQLVPWTAPPTKDGDDGLTIWDGSSFLFTSTAALGWWDKAKLLWRYGYTSPTRTQTAVADLLKKFSKLYDKEWVRKHGAFERIEELSEEIGFADLVEETTMEWFTDEIKASERWTGEMVEAATRVNVSPSLHDLLF